MTSFRRRPHYRTRGSELFFLASTRPLATLTSAELRAFEALGRETSPEAVRAAAGPDAEAALDRLRTLGVFDEAGEFPPGRRKVVVIEPHSDDAALSVGGIMWLRRNQIEFTVVTVASRSNFTSYFLSPREFFGVDEVTRIRNEEGAAFARSVGGRHLPLGENEATLRYRDADWSLDFFRAHHVSVSSFNNRYALPADLERWRAALHPVLAGLNGAELWIPLGAGNHSDHELARNACLSLLVDEPGLAADSVVRLYQDVPYDAVHPAHRERILDGLRQCGAELIAEPVAIEAAWEKKLELLAVYASQFKVPAIAHEVAGSAGPDRIEHLHRLARRPARLTPVWWTLDAPHVREALPHARRWLARHRRAPLIRVLALLPPGRWADDVRRLQAAFPEATLELHAPPAAAGEAEAARGQHVRVVHAAGGGGGWLRTALKLALSRPAPTLFLCGERQSQARLLARLWPLSDALVTPTMDAFILALELAREPADRR